MKPNHGWLLAMVLAPLVALAQEEPAPEAVPADSGAQSGEVIDAVSQDASEEQAVGTVPVNSEEEAAAEPATPWRLYVGLDQVNTTLSLSDVPPASPSVFDSAMYRLRAGTRLTDNLSGELQFGLKQATDQPGEVNTDSYYGLFVVASTTIFDYFELAFPVGYARTTVESEERNSAAFGFEAELPVQLYTSSLPDLRLSLGWMTYYQKLDARLYGINFGLRFDFGLGGSGGDAAAPSE